MKTLEIEIKAIEAMTKVVENRFTLQVESIVQHNLGYLAYFYLSNRDEYFVKVYEDQSPSVVFKMLSSVS